jgi:hypothetical protein
MLYTAHYKGHAAKLIRLPEYIPWSYFANVVPFQLFRFTLATQPVRYSGSCSTCCLSVCMLFTGVIMHRNSATTVQTVVKTVQLLVEL